jgi:predicted Fe-Mo cluster-binding NifX family protein
MDPPPPAMRAARDPSGVGQALTGGRPDTKEEVDVRICIPIAENRGLLSPVAARFDAAPMFLLVDTATLAYRTIPNPPPEDGKRWDPHQALAGQVVDAFIVATIGASALTQLTRQGVPVYGAPAGRVADALADLIGGRLRAVRGATVDVVGV